MRRMVPVLSAALLLPYTALGQQPSGATPTAAPAARPVATAVRREGPVTLDGRLDEPAWQAAPVVSGFTQRSPREGVRPTDSTEVRFLYDDEAVYIGARMFNRLGAAGVTSRLSRRDDVPESDILRIDFDPYHDRLHSVEFDVNPAGWRGDATDVDRSWDPVWQAESRVDSAGWTTEIRIPFSQLRFARDSVQTWGLNITRIEHRSQERDQWAFWPRNQPGGPAFFGELQGMRIRRAPEHAEFLPYVVGRTQRLGTADPRSPFYDPHPSDVRVGADFKYLLTSSFTLSATVNPDFGQVEVDPAVVNLSAYETFFPEKRPFFVEGSDVFGFGTPGCNINCGLGLNLFYSRRIGRPPQGAGLAFAAGDFADVPSSTTILGAAKLTGRTRSGYSVGVIDALTRREVAEVAVDDTGRVFQPVEPLTNSFVARVKRELMGGNLVVGGIATSANRRLDDPGLAALLTRSAQTAGVDAEYFWANHTWHAYGALTASRAAGDSLAIARLQRSPARYFQRPDRSVSPAYDPSARSLGGYGGIMRISKEGGSWIGDLNAAMLSPGFEANDLGFLQTVDWRWVNGTLGRQYTRPTRWYRTFLAMAGAEQQWNYDGDNTGRDVSLVFQSQLLNYWNVSLFGGRSFATQNDRLTRGGPVVGQSGANSINLNVSGDPRKRVVLSSNLGFGKADDGGHNESLSLTASVKPAANVRISVGPGYSRSAVTDQYVASLADPTATAFFGRRYVFAHLDQKQLYMETRLAWTFTPRLSLDLYAQPLLASGDYYDFEEFARPRTQTKLVYGRDVGTITQTGTPDDTRYVIDPDGPGPASSFTLGNPDFNFRSLRGTGVLRWEWRPGSTAYFVWTQTRSGIAPVGNLDFIRDQRALFNAPADNIFVIKVSYWIGL
jgi:uncharacterized protein DUF5916